MRIHRFAFIPMLLLACVPPPAEDGSDENAEGSESDTDESPCQPGTLACECVEGLCFDDLACVQGICTSVDEDTSSSEDSSDSRSDDPSDSSSSDSSDSSSDDPSDSSSSDSSSEDGDCKQLGCACEGSPDSCDPGLVCSEGLCSATECGDGLRQGLEQCDDGNDTAADGCELDCTATGLLDLALGENGSCVLVEGGSLRCWGGGPTIGQVNEYPGDVHELVFDEPIVQVALGTRHQLALTADGGVRCWGQSPYGECGYGNKDTVGDDEPPTSGGDVAIGGKAVAIYAGHHTSCALLESGNVRCWGVNPGYGIPQTYSGINIGDDELPSSVQTLPLGEPTISLSSRAYASGTCALLESGKLRCWGANDLGQFGYGHTMNFLVSPSPAHAPIPLGLPGNTKIVAHQSASLHSCTLYDSGDVQCWGDWRRVGQGGISVGDDELPSTVPPLSLDGSATSVSTSRSHSCAVLDTQEAICWGNTLTGSNIGVPGAETIDLPSTHGPVALDTPVVEVEAGYYFSCARLITDEVICWGRNEYGQLGIGNTDEIGDDEVPTDPVLMF